MLNELKLDQLNSFKFNLINRQRSKSLKQNIQLAVDTNEKRAKRISERTKSTASEIHPAVLIRLFRFRPTFFKFNKLTTHPCFNERVDSQHYFNLGSSNTIQCNLIETLCKKKKARLEIHRPSSRTAKMFDILGQRFKDGPFFLLQVHWACLVSDLHAQFPQNVKKWPLD